MTRHFISLDVGGTHCRIGLMANDVNHKPKILKQTKFSVHQEFKVGIEELSEQIQKISQGYRIESISGGFPGQVDSDRGMIRSADNLPGWNNKPIKQVLQKKFHLPVYVFHDVATGAIGEAIYGSGKGENNFIFMIWGTGFGGTKVEKLLGKYHITSFEPGHHIANRDGELCPCGLYGCPELLIGGGFLSQKLGKKLSDIADNDPLWEQVAEVAGQAVINTLAFHQTPLLIFGGGLIASRPFLFEKLKKIVAQKQTVFLPPKIKMAKLGDDAALYGAVALQQMELI